jgi:hypothetical protein
LCYWGNAEERLVQVVYLDSNGKPTSQRPGYILGESHWDRGKGLGTTERKVASGRRVATLFRESCLPFHSPINHLWCWMGILPDLIKTQIAILTEKNSTFNCFRKKKRINIIKYIS